MPSSHQHATISAIGTHTHIAHHALCRFSSALFGMRNVHVRAAVADTKRPLGTLISTREKERDTIGGAYRDVSRLDYGLATHIQYTSLSNGAPDKLSQLRHCRFHLSNRWAYNFGYGFDWKEEHWSGYLILYVASERRNTKNWYATMRVDNKFCSE